MPTIFEPPSIRYFKHIIMFGYSKPKDMCVLCELLADVMLTQAPWAGALLKNFGVSIPKNLET